MSCIVNIFFSSVFSCCFIGDEGYTIGLNQYSDWTDEEYFGSQLPKYLPTIETEEIQNIPFVKYVRAVSFVG